MSDTSTVEAPAEAEANAKAQCNPWGELPLQPPSPCPSPEEREFLNLQREIIGNSLKNKERVEAIITDYFDPTHAVIVAAMKSALKRGEYLDKTGLNSHLQTLRNVPFNSSLVKIAFDGCLMVERGRGTPDQEKARESIADIFGTEPKAKTATIFEFENKLKRLQELAGTCKKSEPQHQPEQTELPIASFNLAEFPEPIRDFVNAMARKNRLVPPILLLGAAYAAYGALIGKGMRCDNGGTVFYPSPWIVCLANTGDSKTGAVRPIERQFQDLAIDRLVPPATMSGLFDAIGMVISKKDWDKLSAIERTQKVRDLVASARHDKRGRILLSDECTGALELLLGGWDSKRPSRDLQDLLQLADGGAFIPRQTNGSGYRAIADCCMVFLGFTQNETWQEKFGADTFKNVGLFGRFIPFSTKNAKLIGVNGESSQPLHILMNIPTASDTVDCYFGEPVPYGEADAIGKIKSEIANSPVGKRFQHVYPREYGQLQNKIVCHAIRLSMIDAYLEDKDRDGLSVRPRVDCLPYFKRHAEMVMALYLAYLDQVDNVSRFGKLRERVVENLRKFGALTLRDLKKRINFYGKELEDVVKDLITDKIVTGEEKHNKNGTKTLTIWLATAVK